VERFIAKRLAAPPEDSQLLHARVKCGPLQSQTESSAPGATDHPVHVLQSLADVLSLSLFQRYGLQRVNFGSLSQSSSGGRSVLPPVRITLRSMKFCSSRMFPGQEWPTSASITSAGIDSICLCMRSE